MLKTSLKEGKKHVKLTAKSHTKTWDFAKFKNGYKAQKLIESINKLIDENSEYEPEVRLPFEEFMRLFSEAKEAHELLLVILPVGEAEKHEIWFKAKMIPNNELIEQVNKWLSDTAKGQEKSETGEVCSDVGPGDSVSNCLALPPSVVNAAHTAVHL